MTRLAALAFVCLGATSVMGADLNIYGPGGPQPAMKEAAADAFGKQRGISVAVTAGPAPSWIERAMPGTSGTSGRSPTPSWPLWCVLLPRVESIATLASPSQHGHDKPAAGEFVALLKSPEGQRIFVKWGWMADQT